MILAGRHLLFRKLLKCLKTPPGGSQKLLSGMVKRGLLLRLKEGSIGLFRMIKTPTPIFLTSTWWSNIWSGTLGSILAITVRWNFTALSRNLRSGEQIVVNRQVKPSSVKIKGHKFQFIYHNRNHYFGAAELWVDSFNKASCSDLEKPSSIAFTNPTMRVVLAR